MQRAGRMRHITRAARWHNLWGQILVAIADKSRTPLWHHTTTIFRSNLNFNYVTTVFEKNKTHIWTSQRALEWTTNLTDTAGQLPRSRLRQSKSPSREPQISVADTISRLTTTGDDQAPIRDDLSVSFLEPCTEDSSNICLIADAVTASREADKRAVAQVVEDNTAKKKEVASAFQEFLQHQATDAFCKQVFDNISQTNAVFIVDDNGLMMQMALIDGAIQIMVP